MSHCTKSLQLAALVSVIAGAPLALAHHSFSAFDMQQEITLQGVVETYTLQNPHAHLTIKVAGKGKGDKNSGLWDIEGAAANIMRRQGWDSRSFKSGDPITVVGHPLRSGERGLSLFYAIKSDGTRMYQDIARPVGNTK